MSKHGEIGRAARKADIDRKTARKYISAGKLPSEMVTPRAWRTREDTFSEHWPEVERRLREAPELEAKTLFEMLVETYPGRYEEGQLRTLQRRVRQWRAEYGPDRDIVLAQRHRPGEAAQTDFTSTGELGVTIAGQLFLHLLCVFVLPYSNWQWVTVCLSESMAALRRGVQRALFQIGRVPRYHQTDNSTAATHRIPDGKSVMAEGGKRPFNEDYLALMRHFGMIPRTIEVGAKEQNGDVEASNGALKRRLTQALALRGSRDFESVDAWQNFIDQVQRKANAARGGMRRAARRMSAKQSVFFVLLPLEGDSPAAGTTYARQGVVPCPSESAVRRTCGARARTGFVAPNVLAKQACRNQRLTRGAQQERPEPPACILLTDELQEA